MTPSAIDAFRRDGYMVVPGHITLSERIRFLHAFIGLRQAMSGRDNGELYDAAWLLPEFLRIVGKPDTTANACALLGLSKGSPLYAYNARLLIQPPGDDSHCWDWHQEVFHAVPETRCVQTWAPLIVDATEENGAIEVLPGSHKEGIAPQAWTDDRTGYALVDPSIVAKYKPVTLPMPVGSMLFFDSRLVHRSGKNRSTETRYAAVGVYTDVAGGFRAPRPRFDFRGKTPQTWLGEQRWD
jgi:ectoine hydroxylase-related dioxygenase (phytanoyl-CoA dioxygenase family)